MVDRRVAPIVESLVEPSKWSKSQGVKTSAIFRNITELSVDPRENGDGEEEQCTMDGSKPRMDAPNVQDQKTRRAPDATKDDRDRLVSICYWLMADAKRTTDPSGQDEDSDPQKTRNSHPRCARRGNNTNYRHW